MSDNEEKELYKLLNEIKDLHNLTESDVVCLRQLMLLMQMTGYSPELSLKLLKALTDMMEITVDSLKRNK